MKYYHCQNKKKNYFEGWYFKHNAEEISFAFIPSYALQSDHQKGCYIQFITPTFSHQFTFPYDTFIAKEKELYIKIANNLFTAKEISLNLKDNDYHIICEIKYEPFQTIKNIMGPFAFIPFMECNHAIISMKHTFSGYITINDKTYIINQGIGYIESDYGSSFPQKYQWLQVNDFPIDAALVYSSATIPFLGLKFQGLICSLLYNRHEYRFATYNLARVKKVNHKMIIISKGKYILKIKLFKNNYQKLSAPLKGNMNRYILETIDGKCEITLTYKNQVLLDSVGIHAGIELNDD